MLLAALFIQLVRLARDLVIEFLSAHGETVWLHVLWTFLPLFAGRVRCSSFPSICLCHVYASFAARYVAHCTFPAEVLFLDGLQIIHWFQDSSTLLCRDLGDRG